MAKAWHVCHRCAPAGWTLQLLQLNTEPISAVQYYRVSFMRKRSFAASTAVSQSCSRKKNVFFCSFAWSKKQSKRWLAEAYTQQDS